MRNEIKSLNVAISIANKKAIKSKEDQIIFAVPSKTGGTFKVAPRIQGAANIVKTISYAKVNKHRAILSNDGDGVEKLKTPSKRKYTKKDSKKNNSPSTDGDMA